MFGSDFETVAALSRKHENYGDMACKDGRIARAVTLWHRAQEEGHSSFLRWCGLALKIAVAQYDQAHKKAKASAKIIALLRTLQYTPAQLPEGELLLPRNIMHTVNAYAQEEGHGVHCMTLLQKNDAYGDWCYRMGNIDKAVKWWKEVDECALFDTWCDAKFKSALAQYESEKIDEKSLMETIIMLRDMHHAPSQTYYAQLYREHKPKESLRAIAAAATPRTYLADGRRFQGFYAPALKLFHFAVGAKGQWGVLQQHLFRQGVSAAVGLQLFNVLKITPHMSTSIEESDVSLSTLAKGFELRASNIPFQVYAPVQGQWIMIPLSHEDAPR